VTNQFSFYERHKNNNKYQLVGAPYKAVSSSSSTKFVAIVDGMDGMDGAE